MSHKKIKILFLIICTFQLFYLWQYRSSFHYEILKESFKKNGGATYAVYPQIIETNKILKKNHVKEFSLSEEFLKERYHHQRTIEFNYPIKMNKNSNLILLLSEEKVSENCTVKETGQYIKLIQC